MEFASTLDKLPKFCVVNRGRGHYRSTNDAYKSALRPASIISQHEPTAESDSQPSNESPFKYYPLGRESGEIRLVALLPSSGNSDELCCKLDHVSFSDSPQYCALSYAWGDPAATKPVTINGKRAFITESLALALHHVRHENESLILWVDALCINQADDQEKMHQMQQMASIYSSAAIVLAWLGPGDIHSDIAIYKLDDLSCRYKEVVLQTSIPGKFASNALSKGLLSLAESLKIGSEFSCDVPIPVIQNLLSKSYWTRIWIQQEIALARGIIFVCGKVDIDGINLTFALQLCLMCTAARSRSTQTVGAQHWDLIGLTAYIPEILVKGRGHEKRLPLTQLLMGLKSGRGKRLAASDPRDYVYGFLGLATEVSKFSIMPDYTKSAADLYLAVSKAIIESGNLDVLRCAGGARTKSRIGETPSWVIDWSLKQKSPMSISPYTNGEAPYFSASGRRSISCKFGPGEILTLAGVQISVIQTIGPTWEYKCQLDEPARQLFAPFVKGLRALCGKDQDECYNFECMWRVPLRNIESLSSYATKDSEQMRRLATEEYSLEGFSALLDYDGSLETLPAKERDKAYSYLWSMNDSANSRPTFVTENGLIGMANSKNFDLSLRSKDSLIGVGDSKEVRPGDVVCIFMGASIPFILREEKDGRFKLVCDAYVQGIMDGEIVNKDHVVRDFNIV